MDELLPVYRYKAFILAKDALIDSLLSKGLISEELIKRSPPGKPFLEYLAGLLPEDCRERKKIARLIRMRLRIAEEIMDVIAPFKVKLENLDPSLGNMLELKTKLEQAIDRARSSSINKQSNFRMRLLKDISRIFKRVNEDVKNTLRFTSEDDELDEDTKTIHIEKLTPEECDLSLCGCRPVNPETLVIYREDRLVRVRLKIKRNGRGRKKGRTVLVPLSFVQEKLTKPQKSTERRRKRTTISSISKSFPLNEEPAPSPSLIS